MLQLPVNFDLLCVAGKQARDQLCPEMVVELLFPNMLQFSAMFTG